jgi:squalene cyclase
MTISEARDVALKVLAEDPDAQKRWDSYLQAIKELYDLQRTERRCDWLLPRPEPKHIWMMAQMYIEAKKCGAMDMWAWAHHYLDLEGYTIDVSPTGSWGLRLVRLPECL